VVVVVLAVITLRVVKVKHHLSVQQYLPLVAVVVEVVTEETVVRVAVLVVTNRMVKE
jgi:hypothetical protein